MGLGKCLVVSYERCTANQANRMEASMLREAAAGVALATFMALSGCAGMDPGACKGLTIGSGALLGATAGGLISGVAAEHGDSGGSKNWRGQPKPGFAPTS